MLVRSLPLALTWLLVPAALHADDSDDVDPLRPSPLLRGGFAMGIDVGVGLAVASGYPSDPERIGLQSAYTETSPGLNIPYSIWIGGAVRDWLTLGLGVAIQAGSYDEGDWNSGAFTFRVQTYPAWMLGGLWRDFGIRLDAGSGSATLEDDAGIALIDGGAAARIGAGVFYDGIRFWKIAMGPGVGASYTWSPTVRQPTAMLMWQSALYGSP